MRNFIEIIIFIILLSLIKILVAKFFGETYNVGWFSGIIFATAIQVYTHYLNDND